MTANKIQLLGIPVVGYVEVSRGVAGSKRGNPRFSGPYALRLLVKETLQVPVLHLLVVLYIYDIAFRATEI